MTDQHISSLLCLLTSILFTCSLFGQDLKQEESQLLSSINQEKNLQNRKVLIDSLLIVFEKQEKAGSYNQKNDLLRATFLFRSASPNPFKIDTLLYRAIQKYQNTVGDAILLQYCANLNSCLHSVSEPQRGIYKTRMFQCAYQMDRWKDQQNYSDRTMQSLQLIQKQLLPACSDYAEASGIWIKDLPKDTHEKAVTLRFILNQLDFQNCPKEGVYEQVLDSVLQAEPSAALWMNKANIQAKRGDYDNEYKSLISAKSICQHAPMRDSIHFLCLENRFKSNEYFEVVRLSREPNTRFKDEILLRAAESVIGNNEQCQVSAFEKRLNCFYALQILKECGETNVNAKEISHSIDPLLPSKEELTKNGLKAGDSYHLKCWDITIKLPL